VPSLLDPGIEKLDPKLSFGGVEPIRVGLFRLLLPTLDYPYDGNFRRRGDAS